MAVWILGISSSHDGAACLLKDGQIHTAIREERLSGVKRHRIVAGRSSLAVKYCLDAAGISARDLSAISVATQRSALLLENDITLNPDLRNAVGTPRHFVSHHLAHAASALALSGFESCAILVSDGVGSPLDDVSLRAETRILGPLDGYEHLTLFSAHGQRIEPLEVHTCAQWVSKCADGLWGFGSLGGMYAAVSHLIFGSADEAGKVMGLAPYGNATFAAEEFLSSDENRLEFSNLIRARIAGPCDEHERTALHANLAASVQAALEETLLKIVRRLGEMTDETRLCLAGGVALNCTANEHLMREAGFEEYFVVPASDDAGTAIGAAYLAHWVYGPTRSLRRTQSDALGRPLTDCEASRAIADVPGVTIFETEDLLEEVATRLAAGEIGGWIQGPAEFGPRALGQRSIIAAPVFSDMKDRINRAVKFREAFRPFAPAIPESHAKEWFDFGDTAAESPFMLRAVPIKPDRVARIPAVAHVDGTGRLQTLTEEDNNRFHQLALRLYEKTGVPILLNTSMNLKDEPIVESPEDAIWTLLGTSMSFCVIGERLVVKAPSFRTILDLVPKVIARSWSLKLPVHDGRLGRETDGEDAFEAIVETPWGEAAIPVRPRLIPLLSAIDGISDGNTLLRGMACAGSTADILIHGLLLLRRLRIITLEAPAP